MLDERIRVREVGLQWKNSAVDVTDRPRGGRFWQINVFHHGIRAGSSREQALAVAGPSVIFFPPYTGQWYQALKRGYSDDWCVCDGDLAKHLQHHGLESGLPIPVNTIGELQRCMRTLYREWKERPPFSSEAMHSLILELMRLCARGRLVEATGDERHTQAILEVRRQLSEHFDRPWTVGEMAAELGLSENRFSFLYKRYCGEAPQRDLTAFRMQHAFHLVRNQPEISISDIAEVCGYDDPLYFSRVFKRFFGRAPSTYREPL